MLHNVCNTRCRSSKHTNHEVRVQIAYTLQVDCLRSVLVHRLTTSCIVHSVPQLFRVSFHYSLSFHCNLGLSLAIRPSFANLKNTHQSHTIFIHFTTSLSALELLALLDLMLVAAELPGDDLHLALHLLHE